MTENAYEIYLDESGKFGDWHTSDDQEQPDKVRVIGGLLVPKHVVDKEETDAEFRNILHEIRTEYFQDKSKITDIHISKLKDFPKQQEVRQKLSNLFQYKMREVQVIFIYDHTHVIPNIRIPGAQLFRNMLVRLLQAIIFYHPSFSSDCTFNCRLAHRRFNYKANVEAQLAGQGFLKLRDAKSGLTEFTAITTADLQSIMDSLDNSLQFPSKRKATFHIKKYAQWDDPFMVMADWLCNQLLFILQQNRQPKEIYDELSKTTGTDRVKFFCPANYPLPEELLSLYYQGDKENFLNAYLAKPGNATFTDHYILDDAYKNTINELKISSSQLTTAQCNTLTGIADVFLEDRAFNRFNEVQTLLDILSRQTVGTAAKQSSNSKWDKSAYSFHDAGLRLANHTGNTDEGVKHYQDGEKIYQRLPDKTILDVRSFHELINRSTITDSNEFAFERAIARMKPIEDKEKQLSELFEGKINEIYGKICGSIAQNYAFLSNHENAEKYFQLAKKNLGEGNFIQISYRAHFALEQKDNNRYFRLLCALFGSKDFTDFTRLIQICFNNNIYEMVFPFHLILKGMLTFPPSRMDLDSALNIIRNNPFDKQCLNNHPWELILTVLGRLYYSTGDLNNAVNIWKQAMGFSNQNKGLTFVMLSHAARARVAMALFDTKDNVMAREILQPIAQTMQSLHTIKSASGMLNLHQQPDFDGKIRPGWFDDVGSRFINEFATIDNTSLKDLCDKFLQKYTFNYW